MRATAWWTSAHRSTTWSPPPEGCLPRLGTDWVDLLLIHWPDHNTPYGGADLSLGKPKQDGKIRHYGVSNFSPAMMDVCESAGHLAANQVGYHLFDRRVERAVLPYTQSHGIGFMAYGTLGFGLLTGAFNESTTFVDWDWRSKGYAFGLPLFQREQFLKQLRVVDTAAANRRPPRQVGRPTRHLLGPRQPRGHRRPGRHPQDRGTEGKRGRDRVAPVRRRTPGNRHAEEGVPTHSESSQITEAFLSAR